MVGTVQHRSRIGPSSLLSAALLVAAAGGPVHGQGESTEQTNSDRGDTRDLFLGAPDDVFSQLADIRFDRTAITKYDPFTLLRGQTQKLNKFLDREARVRIGFALTSLYQYATWSKDERNASATDFDFFGRWRPLQTRDTLGYVIFQTEARFTLATSIPPSDLGNDIGSLWPTTNGFNNKSFSLKQLYWQQFLLDNSLSYRIGQLDQSNVFNTNRLQSANLYFLNSAFSDNPTMAYPNNNLGLDVTWRPHRLVYLSWGISDASGTFSDFSNDFKLRNASWFTAAEVGLTPWIDGLGAGKYRFTFWHTDAQSTNPSSDGFSLSCDQDFGEGLIGFLRYGVTDGHLTETKQILAGGVAFNQPWGKADDVAGIAASWGRPSNSMFRDQMAFEAFYRLQLTPAIQVTPDAQLIINPTFSPQQDFVGVFGVRVRITF